MANYSSNLMERLNKTGIYSQAHQHEMARQAIEQQIAQQQEMTRFSPKKIYFFVAVALQEMAQKTQESNQQAVLRQMIEASQRKAQAQTARDPETVPETMTVLKTSAVGKSELKPKIVGEDPDETE